MINSNSARFTKAFQWAVQSHLGQKRKTSGAPFLWHPLEVAAWVLKSGGSEDQAIAALIHDAVGGDARKLEEARNEFGSRVAEFVDALTDPELPKTASWSDRKKAYIEKVASLSSECFLVIFCEEFHELSEWVMDYNVLGMRVFECLKDANRMQWFWYFKELLKIANEKLREEAHRVLLTEYAARLRVFQSFSLPA
jgi:hypothetical protein